MAAETDARRCYVKKLLLKFSPNSQENTWKTQQENVSGLQLYQKRDSDTGVFLKILRNFKSTLFVEDLRWLLLWLTNYLFQSKYLFVITILIHTYS